MGWNYFIIGEKDRHPGITARFAVPHLKNTNRGRRMCCINEYSTFFPSSNSPSPNCGFQLEEGGRGGLMHERTTSKIFERATPSWRTVPGTCHWQLHFDRLSAGIADFSQKGTMCAPRKRLVIELDGSQHLEQAEYDIERTRCFESKGYKVIRFWNNDVTNNMDAVLKMILNVMEA